MNILKIQIFNQISKKLKIATNNFTLLVDNRELKERDTTKLYLLKGIRYKNPLLGIFLNVIFRDGVEIAVNIKDVITSPNKVTLDHEPTIKEQDQSFFLKLMEF